MLSEYDGIDPCNDMTCDFYTLDEVDSFCNRTPFALTMMILSVFVMLYDYLLKSLAGKKNAPNPILSIF